jgi:hypothetical protein
MVSTEFFHVGDTVYDDFGLSMEVVKVNEDNLVCVWPNSERPVVQHTRYDVDKLSSYFDYVMAHPIEE